MPSMGIVRNVATATVLLAVAMPAQGLHPQAAAAAESITWQACEVGAPTGFQCGTLEVPVDRDDPSAGSFRLALTRLPATSDARLGVLIHNPGGPAQAGRPALWAAASSISAKVRARWDLVTWDPRGVGATTPTLHGCATSGISDLALPAVGSVDWNAALARARGAIGRRNAACVRANPVLARSMGSVAAADDVDAIRAALGEDKIGYWGFSYGTTIGYTLTLRHPERISRMYLDSPVNPSGGIRSLLDSFSWAVGPSWSLLAQDAPQGFATFERDIDTLSRSPVVLSGGRTFTRWDAYLILKLLPTPDGLSLVHSAVAGDAASQTTVEEVLGQADDIGLFGGIRSVIICNDYGDRPSGPSSRALLTRSGRMVGDGGRMLAVGMSAMCAGMPSDLGDPVPVLHFRQATVPALLGASTSDQALLFSGATAMANGFAEGRLITVVNNTHGLWNSGRSECLDRRVNSYFVTGRLPDTDIACP